MKYTIEQFQELLISDPFNVDIRFEYASKLVETERTDDALEQIALIQKTEPDHQLAKELLLTLSNQLLETKNSEELDVIPKYPFAVVRGTKDDLDSANVVSISSTEKIRFSDIAGMVDAKKTVKRRIIDPFSNPGLFNRFKKSAGGGVLLYGPPGCGKTMLAKAIATECEASFLSVGISDILSMYKGESEHQLASVFDRARSSRPAVLFFDELDALAYSRSKANSDYTRTIVNEFLNQLDGSQTDNDRILVLGATNMPWDVDDAMKRPGRFDRQIFVQPLDEAARAELLKRKLVDVPKSDLDYEAIAKMCDYYSGADIDALIEAAKDNVLDDIMEHGEDRGVIQADFRVALSEINPSTLDWLKTARNLVKFGNAGGVYKDVEKYLKSVKMY